MKKKHRGILGFITVLSVMATAACGGNDGVEGGKEGAGSIPPSSQPTEIKIMANYDQATFSDTENRFREMVEKATNTKLSYEVPPTTGYNERLQLMLASGDYPDIIFFPSTTDQSFLNAIKDGVIVPVNDYLSKFPEIKKYSYQASLDALNINQDGKIYGIPRTSIVRNDGFWVRTDWLVNVGLSAPKDGTVSLDEFVNILHKFTFNDPDQNGKQDTYGYSGAVDANKVLQPIVTSAFGILGWQKSNGNPYEYIDATYDRTSDAYKKALQYTQSLYKEGVFDPNSAINDANKQKEQLLRGVVGVAPAFAGMYVPYRDEIKKLNPDADFAFIHVKNEQGEVKGLGAGNGMWGFWAITKTSKAPQKAVEVLNYWLTDEGWLKVGEGFEGIDYKLVDGKKQFVTGIRSTALRRNTMRRSGDTNFFISPETPDDVKAKVTPWLERSIQSAVLSEHRDFLPQAAKKPDYMDYQKVWQQTIMKIVLGSEPVSKFDELLDGWYKNGGNDYVKQMNDYIKGVNKR